MVYVDMPIRTKTARKLRSIEYLATHAKPALQIAKDVARHLTAFATLLSKPAK
jgi:hypothetical protein